MIVKFKRERGFTLLEILVVLVVIVMIAGVAVTRVGKMFRVEVRQTTARLSSTIKYLYNKAATEKRTLRLVFDFESASYWAEGTSEKFLLKKETEEDKKKAEKERAADETDANKKESQSGSEGGETSTEEEKPIKPAAPEFGAMNELILTTQQIPPNVILKDVYTSHNEGPVTNGRAYIYFFPNGFVEDAVVNLNNVEETKNFSLKINPINGDVDVSDKYRELEK